MVTSKTRVAPMLGTPRTMYRHDHAPWGRCPPMRAQNGWQLTNEKPMSLTMYHRNSLPRLLRFSPALSVLWLFRWLYCTVLNQLYCTVHSAVHSDSLSRKYNWWTVSSNERARFLAVDQSQFNNCLHFYLWGTCITYINSLFMI